MTTRMTTAAMFAAFLCTGSALAQAVAREPGDAPRALREYRGTTQQALIACGSPFSQRHASARGADALRAYRACVSKARAEVSLKLHAAVRSLEGTPCVTALRSYNIAFEQALTGIEPQPAENPLAYEQRQVFLFHAMAHAWGRFEIAESFAY